MQFKKYIKAVGTGPKGNRELSFEESVDMMNQILDQSVPLELVSAFLLGWRLKPETITEYRGALSALDNRSSRTTIKNSIELGFPFDGKAVNPYLFPLVAKILKKSDLNLVIMGDKRVPAKDGVTTKDICTSLALSENIHYFDRINYLKELSALTDVRNLLGVRSAFNTIEKLPNLGNSDFAITGVFHKPYVQKYNDIFKGRYKRFALLQGNEGSPEIFTKAKLWVTDNEGTQELMVDPAFYGISYDKSTEDITLKDTLEFLADPTENTVRLAKLNAAIYLFVANFANTIEEGFERVNNF
jgi:anthranilate phosphoribosyltransferase